MEPPKSQRERRRWEESQDVPFGRWRYRNGADLRNGTWYDDIDKPYSAIVIDEREAIIGVYIESSSDNIEDI
jgi:hypothetical protein